MLASAILELPIMGALVFMDISAPLSSLLTHPLFLLIAAIYPIVLSIWWFHPTLRRRDPELLRYMIMFWLTTILAVLGGAMWTHWGALGGNLSVRLPGRLAFTFLAVGLMMSPLNTLTHRRYESVLLPLRKIFGVVSFLLFLAHAFRFVSMMYGFSPEDSSPGEIIWFLWSGTVSGKMTLVGLIAGVGMLLLGITSNTASYRILGRRWKTLHRLVYPIFVLSIIHVVWAEQFSGYYTFLLASVSLLRVSAFLLDRKKWSRKPQGRATKYLCLVCGYIYDETLGDPDSGIAPGTRWEDIPNDWYCPICKVGKKDFEPYYDGGEENPITEAIVTSVTRLTTDVIELIIRTSEPKNTLPGQFFRFVLRDADGEFERSYSVAHEAWNLYTFLIRIKPGGRAGKIWETVQSGDNLKISRTGWVFTLRNTKNPKIFIATGTGLAPIYRMILSLPPETPKTLYFGVRDKSDLYYEERLREIPNLSLHIYLSREQAEWYEFGRIDANTIEASTDAEFYICGGPTMTTEVTRVLQSRGFANVSSEAFE